MKHNFIKTRLLHLRQDILDLIKKIGEEAHRNDFCAYVVGGFVRDLILKRPNLDLDVVVEGDAVSFAKMIAEKNNAAVIIYRQFGTATLTLTSRLRVDIATARKETYSRSGALPKVTPGRILDDLFRRDFTINAMAVAINPFTFGDPIDEYNGMEDLRKGKIRVLHPQSFIDDPTRILRAVRFEQRFDFKIEPSTLHFFKDALRRNVVENVTPARYFEEFSKILRESDPQKCIKRLKGLRALKFMGFKPKVDRSMLGLFKEIKASLNWFESSAYGSRMAASWLIYFMVLAHKMNLERLKDFLAKVNLKKEDREKVISSRQAGRIFAKLRLPRLRSSGVYDTLKSLSYETLIFFYAQEKMPLVRRRIADFFNRYDTVKLQINGDDLKSLGVVPGKKMGMILKEVLYQKIDGQVRSRLEELDLAESLNNRMGS